MFPIRDHNPSGRVPYVTRTLVVLNVVIFLAYWYGLPNDWAIHRFFQNWGIVPAYVAAGERWETFLSSQFLHAGWMHLLGNMLYLWIFGDNVEDQMGHAPFLVFYLAGGALAAGAQVAAEPFSAIPTVGASGAIAAVLGGYLLLYPKARVDVLFIILILIRIIPIRAWIVLGAWFGLQIFGGVSSPADQGGVAYWAHAGGFVAGLVMALPLWLARGGPAFWARTQGSPPHPEAPIAPSSVPRVLRRRP
jgi:membrane associated rhomboid family serine protease